MSSPSLSTRPWVLALIALALFTLLLVWSIKGFGQTAAAPAPTSPTSPTSPTGLSPVSEITRLRLLNAYRKAVLAQQTVASAQATLQQAIDGYNADAAQGVKEEKLPVGTTFSIDLAKDMVVVVAPPPPPTPAPAPAATPAPAPTPKK